MGDVVVYFDPFSNYAYMAESRIDDLIPDSDWRPVYIFGLHQRTGRTPWVLLEGADERRREASERAVSYGLPPIVWPTMFPSRHIDLVRAAAVAKEHGTVREFARAAGRAVYADGVPDVSTPAELARLASSVGLDPDALLARIADDDIKERVRAETDEAFTLGVVVVPSIMVDGEVFWGDDRLEDAAAKATASV